VPIAPLWLAALPGPDNFPFDEPIADPFPLTFFDPASSIA
jgi:hypothetical protein